jgi:hypothetical protein
MNELINAGEQNEKMTKMMATPPATRAPPNSTPVTKESKGNSLPLLTWSRKLPIDLDRLIIDRTYPESPTNREVDRTRAQTKECTLYIFLYSAIFFTQYFTSVIRFSVSS